MHSRDGNWICVIGGIRRRKTKKEEEKKGRRGKGKNGGRKVRQGKRRE